MKRILFNTAIISLLLILGIGTANAQYRGGRYRDDSPAYRPGVIQITPYFGFLFGDDYDAEIVSDYYYGQIEQDDCVIGGIRVGFGIAKNIGLEFQFAHASTEFYGVTGSGFFDTRSKLSDISIYQILGNVNFDFGNGPVLPYFVLGMGTTVYDMDNGGSDSEFTGTMAGGVKARIASNIALRLEIRGYVTQVQDSEYNYYWDGHYYDWVNYNDDYLTTLEASLGLSFFL